MKTVGITGGIGSGKSIVSKIIEQFGFPVFYSDNVAKQILATDERVRYQVKLLLGEKAYIGNAPNREYIASQIFSNENLKNQLNAIIHPTVREAFTEWSKKQKGPMVFNEAAILFETGSYKYFDKVILVTAPVDIRIQRVQKRDRCTEDEVRNRMKNQWDDEKKIPLADYVIQNDDHHSLIAQLEKLLLIMNS